MLYSIKNLILSKTAKDSSVMFLGNGVSAILGIIITILAARFLGPEDWGIAASILSFIIMLSAIADFGFGSGLFRFVSRYIHQGNKEEAVNIVQVIFSVRVITAIFLSSALIILAGYISLTFFKSNDASLIVLAAFGLLGLLLLDFQIAYYQAKQNFKQAAIFISLANIIRLLGLVGLIYLNNLNLFNLLLLYFGSSLISFFIAWSFNPIFLKFDNQWHKTLSKVFGFSGWMGINRVISVINSRVDVLLLLQLSTSIEVGIFAAAKQLASGVPLVFGSFATVLAPRLSSLEGNNLRRFYKKSLLLSLVLAGGLLLAVFVCEPIISLFGDKYKQSIVVLQLLFIGLIPFALSTPSVNFLIYSANKPKLIAFLTLFQLPFVILGNIYSISKLGVLGPVIISGLVNLSTMIVTYYFVYRILKR